MSDSPELAAIRQRAESRIQKSEGCWNWIGTIDKSTGYGVLCVHSKNRLAHRLVYELLVGAIPPGLEIDHLCRNRACVRPDHLEPVTRKENQRRGFAPWGINGRKTHCVNGHEFTDANTRINPADGGRQCRKCALDRYHRSRRRANG